MFVPDEELHDIEPEVPDIRFHCYTSVSTCSIHKMLPKEDGKECSQYANIEDESQRGKVSTRKELQLVSSSISDFHANHYVPAIEKLHIIFHMSTFLANIIVLSCVKKHLRVGMKKRLQVCT